MRHIWAVFAAYFVARTVSEGGDKDASFKVAGRFAFFSPCFHVPMTQRVL
jgi:hypothetical protein